MTKETNNLAMDNTNKPTDFQREERFIVVKRKHLPAPIETELRGCLERHGIPTVECVVVESDWPEYETVWAMIEARCTGRTPDELARELEAIPIVTEILNVDTGWRGEQSVRIPVDLRDRILSRLTTPSGVAEQVREAAAKVAERIASGAAGQKMPPQVAEWVRSVAAAIRSMPLPKSAGVADPTPPADDVLREALEEAIGAIEGRNDHLDQFICCGGGSECGCRGSTHRDLLIRDLRATLKASPTAEPNPEGTKVAERVLPACNLGCEQNCPADYPNDLCCVTRRAVAAMQEASHTMKFSRVFIGSREKMHPDGQDLYDAALAQLNAALSTLTATPSHLQEQS